MFIQNKYYRWYLAIIERDDVEGYRERHHKIPRALGGDNTNQNLVRLSARKHFLAHWLLTKCTQGEDQRAMFWAFASMSRNPSGERNLSSWQFARAREAYRSASLGRPSPMTVRGGWSPEERLQIGARQKGRKLSTEHKEKIGKGLKGKTLGLRGKGGPRKTPLTPQQVIEYRERMTGNTFCVGIQASPETKAKLSAGLMGNQRKLGFKDPPDTQRKKQLSQLNRPTWGKSGLKGVSRIGHTNRWRGRLKVGKQRLHLGVFDCPAAAHLMYIVAADKVRREESCF